MQLLYNFFYKQFGIRRIQHLLAPRLFSLNSLPRNSIYHYLTYDLEQPDIDTSKLFFGQYSKRILVDYCEELKGQLGSPKRKATLIKMLFRPFHIQNKKFKYQKDHFRVIKDDLTLLVTNYNYLDVIYRYVDLPMTKYYRWHNVQSTLWDNVNTIAKETNRNQFIFVNTPKELPSFSLLNMYVSRVNITLLKIFDNHDKLFILELWKWLNEETKSTSFLSKIDPENLNKVNLVFNVPDGRSAVLNLGYLNSWIKGSENTTEFNNITQFSSLQVQKLFLKFMLTLQSSTPDEDLLQVDPETGDLISKDENDIQEIKELEEEEEDYKILHEEDEDLDPLFTAPIDSDNVVYSGLLNKSKKNTFELNKNISDNDKIIDKNLTVNVSLDKQLLDIDAELESLELLNKRQLEERGLNISKNGEELEAILDIDDDFTKEDIEKIVFKDKDYEHQLLDIINHHVDAGTLSASEYKKALKAIDNYKAMKDPYGSDQLVIDKMQVKPSDIQLSESKIAMNDNSSVLDKTMLASSLSSFDYDYITKVLEKDILSLINGIQKSGVIIKDHEIQTENSALGSYEHHTLELTPLDGAPSTIHFKIPKINPDGTFMAAGNKYSLRKQRVD